MARVNAPGRLLDGHAPDSSGALDPRAPSRGAYHERSLAPERILRAPTIVRTRVTDPNSSAPTGPGARRRRVRFGRFPQVVLACSLFTVVLLGISATGAALAYHHYNAQVAREADVIQKHDPHIRDAAKQLHAENYLVIGSDSRAGTKHLGNVAGQRSDTTMLVHLSPDRKKATVISIPRDSWVHIPSCKTSTGKVIPAQMGMFNAAFEEGGASCMVSLVQSLTGIEVNHYVEINLAGFEKIVNAVGGVTICTPTAIHEDDQYGHVEMKAGNNFLNGAQALAYVRLRHIGDGSDLERIVRQQRFLGAVLREARGGKLLSDPAELTSFLDAATKAVTVDSGTSIADLKTLFDVLRGLDPKKVTFFTPTIANAAYDPANPSSTHGSRVLLDYAADKVLYDEVINDSTLTVGGAKKKAAVVPTKVTVAPKSITVDVFNGTTIPQLATKTGASLVGRGFVRGTLTGGNSSTGATTTLVTFDTAETAAARTVAAALPNSKLVLDTTHTGAILVTVGTAYKGTQAVTLGGTLPTWARTVTKASTTVSGGISASDTTCSLD